MTPLHYATFGGIGLKLLYLFLGLSLAVITALGMMMWVERRLHGNAGKRAPWVYRTVSRVTVGVACGLPLATVAIFYADRLVPVTPEGRIPMIGTAYFVVWALGLVYALLRANDYRATRELILASGVLLAGIPLLDAATTGDFFLTGLWAEHTAAAWVNAAALVLGGGVIAVAISLPSGRTAKERQRVYSSPEPAMGIAE